MYKKPKNYLLFFLILTFSFLSISLIASGIDQYLLVKAEYPIFINNSIYSEDLPLLNYQGFTYVPLRALSQLLGVQIDCNDSLRRVEIIRGSQSPENIAFRNIIVNGSKGDYSVVGEARVFEATLNYEVEDGHILYSDGFATAEKGAPDWGLFRIDIQIPEQDLPFNGTLMLILFEISAEDGTRNHELPFVLETFLP